LFKPLVQLRGSPADSFADGQNRRRKIPAAAVEVKKPHTALQPAAHVLHGEQPIKRARDLLHQRGGKLFAGHFRKCV
jgi:hypothetical protein